MTEMIFKGLSILKSSICGTNTEPEDLEIRIVLLGEQEDKECAWKTILGSETFEASAPRKLCRLGIREWKERRVVLIDTPAISDLGKAIPSSQGYECLHLSRPGPHALVLATQLEQFSKADQTARPWIQAVFGREAMKRTILVSTRKEPLGTGNMKDRESSGENKDHQAAIQPYIHHVTFDSNKLGERQAEELLAKVEEIVKNHQNRYLAIIGRDKISSCLPKEMESKGPGDMQEDSGVEEAEEAMEVPGMSPDKEGEGFQAEATTPNTEDADNAAGPESHQKTPEEPELRLVLVGKTGAGKSATGNTILGEERFESRLEFSSVTKSCQLGIREWKGKRVVVLDTPAIFDSEESPDPQEIERCRRLSSPRPHALALVSQLGRFTEEDRQAAKQVKKIFGPEAQNYTVIVFTHREDLRKVGLEDYIAQSGNKHLKQLIKACGDRYCGFNNNEVGEKQEGQAEELLSKIEEMVLKNKGKPISAPKQGKKRGGETEEQKQHETKKKESPV